MNEERNLENLLSALDEEEISLLLKDIEPFEKCKCEKQIKESFFEKANIQEKAKKGKNTVKNKYIFSAAACFAIVLSVLIAFVFVSNDSKIETLTTQKFQSNEQNNPLMLAISNADESLIDSLLQSSIFKDSVFLNSDVLNYAIESLSSLSYTTVSSIAQCVYDKFGTTNLDPLLEKTLLGDNEGAIEELEKKDDVLSSYTDKISFFFASIFCDSDVLDMFTEKGADINAKDAAGNSIYELATKYGNKENAEYAKQHGVNI